MGQLMGRLMELDDETKFHDTESISFTDLSVEVS